MTKLMKTLGLMVLGVAIAGVALFAVTTSFAQDAPDDPAAPESEEARPEGRRGPNPFGDERPELDWLHEATQEAAAEALGLSVEELEAAREEGVKLDELAEEAGVEVEAVKEAVEAARTEAIEQALVDGTITDEQAQFLLERSGKGNCGPGGHGRGRGGRGPGNGPAPEGGEEVAPAISG